MQILQTIWTALTTENTNLIAFINFPLSIIEIFISTLLFTHIFSLDTNKKTIYLYTLTFSISACLSRYIIREPYGTFFNLILCPILIVIFFRTTILKGIMSEILPTLILALIDFIIIKFYGLLNISTNEIIKIPLYRFSCSLIEYFTLFLVYLFIKYTNIKLQFYDFKNRKQDIIFTLNSILGILTIFMQMFICAYYIKVLPMSIFLLSFSSLIFYFIISIYSLISTNKLNIAKQNLEETRLMNKTLTILNDKIRAFRHDFNNIIQALGGYIQAKDMDGLEKYYSQLLKDCQEVTNLSGLNQESINNPAIYSLLASKYYLATEKGIEFNLDIFMDLNSIDMKIYEFCRILGILLDNAIQATQECEEKQITVTIRKDNRCKRQLLIVENTYKEKDIDTEKIFEKGYSTKEGNTGLGLWEVRQILLKNTNLNLFTSKDNTYFKQQLEIYKS